MGTTWITTISGATRERGDAGGSRFGARRGNHRGEEKEVWVTSGVRSVLNVQRGLGSIGFEREAAVGA